MNRHIFTLGLATLSLIAAPLAFAQDVPQDPAAAPASGQVTWSELDADGDGALSKTEAAPVDKLAQAFDSADTDKNGSLTADEYKAYVANQEASPTPSPAEPEQR